MKPEIKKEFTLKIKDAEILESQLSAEDLRVLQGPTQGGGVEEELGVLCPGTYCSGGYSDETSMLGQVFNPEFLERLSKRNLS